MIKYISLMFALCLFMSAEAADSWNFATKSSHARGPESLQMAASVRTYESRVRKYQRKIARTEPGSAERKTFEQRLYYNLGKLRNEYEIKLGSPSLSAEKRQIYVERRENLIDFLEKRANEGNKDDEAATKRSVDANQVTNQDFQSSKTSAITTTNTKIVPTKVD